MQENESPLKCAKRRGEAFVKLVIDERHLKNERGKLTIEGPVSERGLEHAKALWVYLATDTESETEGGSE